MHMHFKSPLGIYDITLQILPLTRTFDRELFAPDLDVNLIPPWIFLSSPRNITIERGWRPLFEKWGMNILFFFNQGALGGFYKPNDYLHK